MEDTPTAKFRRISATTTLRREEIEFLHQLFTILARGGDPRHVIRRKVFGDVFRKVQGMKGRITDG